MSALRIAVDVMGGDLGIDATIPAVIEMANRYPTIEFQLYGESAVETMLSSLSLSKNLTLILTTDSIHMGDSPGHCLRHKRHSSMAKSIESVANKQADGCISAGNTGALVAMGLHFLKTYKGIDRPALCQAIPTATGHSYMLDLGANVDCSVKQLQQFAYLGSALCSVLDDKRSPSLCLLNLGLEAFKGPSIVQEAASLLDQDESLNYHGFIEGNAIYEGVADVIVCDGFAGNVALKASEGVARFVTSSFKQIFEESLYVRLMALLSKPALRRWQARMNPDRYNGAYLLGLQGTVVKSHGAANKQQFGYALEMLITQLQRQHTCSMEQSLEYYCTNHLH